MLISMLLASTFALADSRPDILFITPSHFGGVGRLTPNGDHYDVLGGRIFTYVNDNDRVRLMRPNEGGGSMMNPEQLAVSNARVYGAVRTHLEELNPSSGEVLKSVDFDENIQTLVAINGEIVAVGSTKTQEYDANLATKGTPHKIESFWNARSLRTIATDNPNAYTDCVGGCNLPLVIRSLELNPLTGKVTKHEAKIEKTFLINHAAAYDDGWIIENGKHLEYRLNASLAKVAASVELPGEVLAMTETKPVYAVIKSSTGVALCAVEVGGSRIAVTPLDLAWARGRSMTFALSTEGANLYLGAGSHFGIYAPGPREVLHQEFKSASGNEPYQFERLYPAHLTPAAVTPDDSRIREILKKQFWDDQDQAELASAQLGEWAKPLLLASVKDPHGYYNQETVALKKLVNLKVTPSDLLPWILERNMTSSYNQDQRKAAFELIKASDPTGEAYFEPLKKYLHGPNSNVAKALLKFIGTPKALELAK